ncbi:Serpentine Receptor, class BC (Class B-like) [Caenorhabditis elegans]|uniref:Serpentine Receptor, class BC (Class B-like) n=1 Tax=Caenorhabditis elegans TaxID=6239 RepID=H8W3X3_CAEEL|nr:Serpentine Receptor, class BC (Class B-like) [Caenorhabditis elegans]CCG28062.1 Serpentine Receptor, class BC (Class B-like) [Caenorhabditis elegans]|eukprot:NP_001257061.1 Uncharacterized protein CELE_C03G5.14 [Caenorhabditis elegans]
MPKKTIHMISTKKFHPLALTLIIYTISDLVYSFTMGISAFTAFGVWSNFYYPLLHSGIVSFSVLSVYFIAYSNIKLALALHGLIKIFIFSWTMHTLCNLDLYQIKEQDTVVASIYYVLTFIFEMTAFFVINKMNIPFFSVILW